MIMPSVERTLEAPDVDARPLRALVTAWIGKYGALVFLVFLFVFFSIDANYFLTTSNLLEILNEAALSAIISCGMTIVLATNQFDLSLGYNASLSGIVVASLMSGGVPAPLAIGAALLVGLVIGMINGFLVTRVGVNALVATLGVGSSAVGVNYLISNGAAVTIPSLAFTQISIGHWLAVPKDVYYMGVVAVVLWIVLNRTVLGRNIQAVGGNAEAARLAGINVRRVTSSAFVIAGVAAALTGILLTSIVGSGQPTGGDSYTLSAFAAAFLGTAVLHEGRFHIVGTVVGCVIIAVGFNGLTLLGVVTYVQYLFSGLVLIAAVSASSLARQLQRSA
jgi:ribose transport system permease protein